jgi:hypothetical protein
MVDVDTIFKALRLVPEFDGNPHILPRFIHLCDQIAAEYILEGSPNNELANLCLINGILNKITGPAARIINSNGISENWNCIKTALINNFSDQRDETALYNDLMLATQGNNSHQEFYDHCVNLFSTIMTYVTLHENIVTTIEAKRTLYKKLTMQAFVRGLKEPLGSRIRCMRPDSIEKALEFVQEEMNVMYLQNRGGLGIEKKPMYKPTPPAPPAVPPFRAFNFSAPSSSNWQHPNPSFRPINHTNHPAHAVPRGPMGIPTRTQQMFRAPPPNYNPNQNRFQLQSRNNYQQAGPKPMSGVSHYVVKERPSYGQMTGHDWRRQGNPPPSNYFKSREINTNECASYSDYYYPEYNYYSEPADYYNYYDTPVYYDTDPQYYAINEPEFQEYEMPSVSPTNPEPSAPSAEEQDFRKRRNLENSK